MGNSQPNKKYDKSLEKQKFEIACIKVKAHLELQRDRRQNEINGKEKALHKMISLPTRSKQDECHKASSIITDKNYVKACNIIIRFSDIVKDRSMHICESKGKSEKIEELLPYIESIIWSAKPLNLSCISEFQTLMTSFFGPEIYESVQKSTRVDPELKECFKELLPTPPEINKFFLDFIEKYSIPREKLNSVGHGCDDFPNSKEGGFGGPAGGPGNGGMYNVEMDLPQVYQPFQPQFQQPIYPQPYMGGPPGGFGFPIQPGQYQPQPVFYPPAGNNTYPVQQQPILPVQPQPFLQQQQQPFPQAFQQQPPAYQQPPVQNYPPSNQNAPVGIGAYPDFNMKLPNNQNVMNQIGAGLPTQDAKKIQGAGAGGVKTANADNNALPSLDDFEERMKKLRGEL